MPEVHVAAAGSVAHAHAAYRNGAAWHSSDVHQRHGPPPPPLPRCPTCAARGAPDGRHDAQLLREQQAGRNAHWAAAGRRARAAGSGGSCPRQWVNTQAPGMSNGSLGEPWPGTREVRPAGLMAMRACGQVCRGFPREGHCSLTSRRAGAGGEEGAPRRPVRSRTCRWRP